MCHLVAFYFMETFSYMPMELYSLNSYSPLITRKDIKLTMLSLGHFQLVSWSAPKRIIFWLAPWLYALKDTSIDTNLSCVCFYILWVVLESNSIVLINTILSKTQEHFSLVLSSIVKCKCQCKLPYFHIFLVLLFYFIRIYYTSLRRTFLGLIEIKLALMHNIMLLQLYMQ